MELQILMMAFQKLSEEHELLKKEVASLSEAFQNLNGCKQIFPVSIHNIPEDELMDLKEVQSKLGICYNSLKKLINQGLIKPIRINKRRLRFSKLSILNYIQTQTLPS